MQKKNISGFLGAVEFVLFLMLSAFLILAVNTCRDFSEEHNIQTDIANIASYKTLMEGFRSKYGQLPGDFNGAKKLWPECADNTALNLSCDGNGNGIWDGSSESNYVFEHLYRAELLDDEYKGSSTSEKEDIYPKLATSGQNIVPAGALPQDVSELFFNFPLPQNVFLFHFENPALGAKLPAQERVNTIVVRTIDEKLDDGNPARGNLRVAYDVKGLYGNTNASELCIYKNEKYKKDDGPYFCNFILKY